MRHWIQEWNDNINRRAEKMQGLSGSYGGLINGASGVTEKAQITTHGGKRDFRVQHPYVGPNSWIRVMPESGTQVIVDHRSDTEEPEIVSYYQREAADRVAQYSEEGKGLYRPLDPGEIEMASSGGALLYMSDRPLLERAAGIVHDALDQDTLSSGSKAAFHWRRLHQHTNGAIGDEERLGVVWRWKKTSPFSTSRYQRSYVKAQRASVDGTLNDALGWSGGPFAKEYLRILRAGSDTVPEMLADFREGDVIDDAGELVVSRSTGNNLRARQQYWTKLGQVFESEVDDLGNFSMSLPRDALVGVDFKIPSGGWKVQAMRDMEWNGRGNWAASLFGSVTWLPRLKFNVGTAADEPGVLGNQLIALFGSLIDIIEQHVHPSGVPVTGAPVASVPQLEALRATYLNMKLLVSDFINFSKVP